MEKMPKGEIKPKEDGDEVVDLNRSSSTQEEDKNKPLTPHDGQSKESLFRVQTQAQGQESSPQDQVSPSKRIKLKPHLKQTLQDLAQGNKQILKLKPKKVQIWKGHHHL